MSRRTESAVRAATVALICFWPVSLTEAWLCSYCFRRSLNSSGVVSGASMGWIRSGVGALVSSDSGAVGLVVSGVFDIEIGCHHFCIKERWGASLLCFVMVLA